MQKSINTQRLERNEVVGRGVGAGLGVLLAGYAPRLLTETMGQLPYLREVAARVVTTSSLSWTTFLAGAIPNAMRTLAYNAAEGYLESTYTKKVLDDSPLFRNVVLYGTSYLSLGISIVLVGKITGIAMITILGYSTIGWVANQVIGIACALFLSFDDRHKEISKKLEKLNIDQINLPKPLEISLYQQKVNPELVEQFPPPHLLPIDLEFLSIPIAITTEIAKIIDLIFTDFIGAPCVAVVEPKKVELPKKKELPSCPCKNYQKKEPKNLIELSKLPSMEEVKNGEVKGILNIVNSCYQNSAMQVLFNLIDTVGEEHFEFYQIINDPQAYKKERIQKQLNTLNQEKDLLLRDVPLEQQPENEKLKYLDKTIKYLTSIINPPEKDPSNGKDLKIEEKLESPKIEEKLESPQPTVLKDNPVLVAYLMELIKSRSRASINAPIDGGKLKKLVDGHLTLLESFLQMRREYKDKLLNVREETVKSFRKAMFDLYLFVEKDEETAQRDPENLLTPLLEVLCIPPMPFQDALTYAIDQENLKKTKELLKSRKDVSNIENKEDIPEIETEKLKPLEDVPNIESKEDIPKPLENEKTKPTPLEKDQKYEFEKNVENHPHDLVNGKNNLRMLLAKIDDHVEPNEKEITLSSLVIQAKEEERENFQRGDLVMSEIHNKEEERILPLQFPDWYDREKDGRPFFHLKKTPPLQVIRATRSRTLMKGDRIPPFTIINLTRATACGEPTHKAKHHTRVIPDKTLKLEVFDPETKTTTTILQELHGACVHSGTTEGGHWTSYTRKGEDWFYCSDKTTKKVTDVEQMFNLMSVNGTVFTYVTKKN